MIRITRLVEDAWEVTVVALHITIAAAAAHIGWTLVDWILEAIHEI